ncbi:MAG TPA: hypothetical protein VJ761_03150, partial [Ktedonobacteraceae bacterium]|nr:hypothetical protein [Ktedonobacteraceae bacterium]
MELSLRLDTLGIVEMRYLRGRERYRDWPPFLLIAASRQARVLAYLSREAVDQLHQQILTVEEATGLGITDVDEEDEDDIENDELAGHDESGSTDPEGGSAFSPAFAQALERLNDLARQRLPEGGSSTNPTSEELAVINENELSIGDEEDALEQLQDAFVQMMEVVRELAEELSTDALKLTTRFRCARIDIFFTQADPSEDDDEDEDEDGSTDNQDEESMLQVEVELALVLRLYEEGRAKTDDLPAIELQLDVDDFEHLHETLDLALERDRRSRRRRNS